MAPARQIPALPPPDPLTNGMRRNLTGGQTNACGPTARHRLAAGGRGRGADAIQNRPAVTTGISVTRRAGRRWRRSGHVRRVREDQVKALAGHGSPRLARIATRLRWAFTRSPQARTRQARDRIIRLQLHQQPHVIGNVASRGLVFKCSEAGAIAGGGANDAAPASCDGVLTPPRSRSRSSSASCRGRSRSCAACAARAWGSRPRARRDRSSPRRPRGLRPRAA
jgi:hypothetical protein